jgi:hypothetical protein
MVDTMNPAITLAAALAAAMLAAPTGAQTMADIRAKAIERCNTQHGVRCDTEDGLREFLAEELARARGIAPAGGGLPNSATQSGTTTASPASGIAGTNPGITTTNPTQPAENPGNANALSSGDTAAGAPGTPTQSVTASSVGGPGGGSTVPSGGPTASPSAPSSAPARR